RRDDLITLIEGAVDESDDAIVRAALGRANLVHFTFHAESIAVKHRVRESDFVPAEVGDSRSKRGIAHRDADHQAESKGAVDDAVSEFGLGPAVFLVQMQRCRIVGQRREEDVVGFGYGTPNRVRELLSKGEFFKVKSGHVSLLTPDPSV